MDPNASVQRSARRKHSKAFKTRIVQACAQPGASVAGIAIAHGLNPNMVQRWRREARRGDLVLCEAPAFIPVVTAPTPAAVLHRSVASAPQLIEIDLHRGALQARVNWPAQSADACAAWLRELFR